MGAELFDNPQTLPMQAHDFAPSRLYAGAGSISDLNLIASESVRVQAGTDIRNFELSARNLRATDSTVLAAGNDILAVANRFLSHPYAGASGGAASYYYDRGSRTALQGPGSCCCWPGATSRATTSRCTPTAIAIGTTCRPRRAARKRTSSGPCQSRVPTSP